MGSSLTGTIIAEKYKLGDRVRMGETADLYDARHILMDKQVSIRILRPSIAADSENVATFFEDAKLASQINDAHLLNITDFGSDREGFVYSIHEPFAGKTLREVITEDGAFPVHSSVEIARQIAQGLSASHAVGRVHGNLSTDSIVLAASDGIAAKVLDFGTASAVEREATEPADFAYLAPEQCAGSERSDARGDIYSLGAIIYEMLAGAAVFAGAKPSEVMLKHIEEMPAPLSSFRNDLPDGLEAVILKALSKNPEMRQQSAEEFADEISAIGTMSAAASAGSRNNLWKSTIVVFVGISLLTAFLIYGTYTKRTEPTTALQPDENGLPVQPLNPATGTEEQTLAAMPAFDTNSLANSNVAMPGTLPGGDGYNPWANGGAPPPGAPTYVPPGGQVITVPSGSSPFMPPECILQPSGIFLCPAPVNTNAATKPTPSPKPQAANSNISVVPQNSPATNTAPPKASPTPATRPERNPRPTPAKSPAADNEKQID